MLRGIIRPFLTKHSYFRHTSSVASSKVVAKPVYSESNYTKEESDKVLHTVNSFENVGALLR